MSENLIEGVGLSAWQRMHRAARGYSWPTKIRGVKWPDCPMGSVLGPPDFVGVGAQRAGSSWWFELISEHPRIDTRPDALKELHFFDKYWSKHFDAQAVRDYHRYFPRRPGQLVGEWTSRYMYDAWTPSLLRIAAPEAKIIAILRDPIDRYVSGLAFDLLRSAPVHAVVADEAFSRGLYGNQLANLMKYFDRSKILVLQYERCVSRTEDELKKTFSFLGLDSCLPSEARKKVNSTRGTKPRLTELEVGALAEAYEDDVGRLAASFPEIDLKLWPRFSHLAGGAERASLEGSSHA